MRDDFKISKTDLDLPLSTSARLLAISTHPLGQLELCPAFHLAECPKPHSRTVADIGGHPMMVLCSLSTTDRL
jgi:hypothetical protein